MMDETVDGGEGHRLVGKDLAPCGEWLVCGDQQRSPFVSRADEFEQRARFSLVL
jgi:hypothetical protein